jgi:hypothetical protein
MFALKGRKGETPRVDVTITIFGDRRFDPIRLAVYSVKNDNFFREIFLKS